MLEFILLRSVPSGIQEEFLFLLQILLSAVVLTSPNDVKYPSAGIGTYFTEIFYFARPLSWPRWAEIKVATSFLN